MLRYARRTCEVSKLKDAGSKALGCIREGASVFFFHSFAANGNTGLSGQAQWLPVAVTTRDCAPKSPTVPSPHATTRVKRVSAPKGPAHLISCPFYSR